MPMRMTVPQLRWLSLAAGAWLIQSYDIGLISVVLLPFKTLYHLSGSDVGLLAASATVGIVIGVVPSGFLADRFGRKRLMVLPLLWYSTLTMLTGWASTWQEVVMLRFVAGIGLGALFPLPYTLLTELSPEEMRGRVVGVLDAFLSVGYFAAPLIGGIIGGSALGTGWRTLFFLGGVGIPYAIALIFWMPESPRWLTSVGRTGEAEHIWRRAGRPPMALAPAKKPERYRPGAIFKPPYRRRTLMIWIAFPSILFVFYAIMTYMPSVLTQEHLSATSALRFAALIMVASIPGKLFESWLVERVGRKTVIVSFTLIAAAAALIFPAVRGNFAIVGLGMVLAFFGIAVDPAVKVYTAEQYPTPIRATGVGMGEGVARLFGGALAPYIMAVILSSTGIQGSFIFVACVAVVGALAVALLGDETRGVALADRLDTVGARPAGRRRA